MCMLIIFIFCNENQFITKYYQYAQLLCKSTQKFLIFACVSRKISSTAVFVKLREKSAYRIFRGKNTKLCRIKNHEWLKDEYEDDVELFYCNVCMF